MGHDVDLFVLDRSRRVDQLLRQRIGAVPGAGSLVHRVAGKLTYVVPGYVSPVEVHHGRLGLLGEHAAYPALLARRRQPLDVDSVRTWIPSREDQLVVQVLQRIYAHLSLRLSDVLHTVVIVRHPTFDWDYAVATARRIGILHGLCCYLGYVGEVYQRSAGTRLAWPDVRGLAMPRWAGHPQFRGDHYGFPRGRVLARVYGAKLLSDLKALDWRGVGKLLLLVAIAVVVGLRALCRRAVRSDPRGGSVHDAGGGT